ncbi:Transthyretin-like family protein [Ancylostoma duodenale]|uniref:Transthyretin-like family protein n=1 Tax=Ancylostoma duodenale TaxID=51022 RepID=A0A0C2CFU7_9BILA|nr:Transthyretin-like family protein [Ancylostoma duodenale]
MPYWWILCPMRERALLQLSLLPGLSLTCRMFRVVSVVALLMVCEALRDQSIAVKGRFLCGSEPAAKVRVKLIDVDTGLDPDDLLSQGYTDARGDFMLSGGTAELTEIDPVLKVYHDCNDVTVGGAPKVREYIHTYVR